MKNKILNFSLAAVAALSLSSCNDWLTEDAPGNNKFDDFFIGGAMAVQTVNGAYVPLAWEFNNSYFSEWFFGDIASDDALKGGQNIADGLDAYDIDNYKVNPNNSIVLDYYRAKYQGISRANLALQQVPEIAPDEAMTAERQQCLMGEAYFLRGLYYFQLVRLFGGVPLITEVVDSSDRWKQPRATVEQVYAQIIEDFKHAEALLWDKSKYPAEDLGRATRGAAQAYLCKAYLYNHDYENAYIWGKKWVDEQYRKGEYKLNNRYLDNWMEASENGPESIFEIQYIIEDTSDYGVGFGSTRGTFTTILCRQRGASMGSDAGWGWNHPTQNLYNEYEAGDPRRDLTIGMPPAEDLDNIEVTYLGSPYFNLKNTYYDYDSGFYVKLTHASRSPKNYILMRAADALLLYAEAALEAGKPASEVKWALEEVRGRARANAADPSTALPAFPYGSYADNTDGLRAALRHERRVELAMEGHRWFDLVRWGIAYDVLDKDNGSYGRSESSEARAEMGSFIKGKCELMPIHFEELRLNPMEQNPGY